MGFTEEMDDIERRMLEEERGENTVAVALMAVACFSLLGLCWALAAVWP